ncbi:PhnA-like protein [Falsirhodobacter sp. 20TX0035]|uniref:PhnA-like protein n=1 Tax=Falsirhodobacter sp. 20TX0035 TaxID=3022019 RepID=UPI00232B7047|nr:PhnA-like protein [Falsirhodobacter sp. 20TX0035]MDB6452898.1 PhnA-like protein [Falsirhodobacter sp. 20TX0035]
MTYTTSPGTTSAVDTLTEDARYRHKNISWGAVLAGVAVALIVHVLLSLLGIGIGMATLDPGTGDNPAASTFSVASAAWYAVSGIIAAFAGGFVAARLSGRATAQIGGLHGLTVFAVTTLFMLYLLSSSIGSIVGGTFSGISSAVGGLSQTVAQAAGPALENANPLDALERQVRSTGNDPEALRQNAVDAIRALATADENGADAARQEAAQALADARNIPLPEAQQQVAQMEQQYRETVEQARQTAVEAADTAANALTVGALAAFVALLAGAIAAFLGGRSGVVAPVTHVTTTRDVRH